jgi:hypothetical protein
MTDTAVKSRENKLRRKARRLGYRLEKSRRFDPDAVDYGLFALIDPHGKAVNPPLPGKFKHSWTIDQVEGFLKGKHK